MILTNRRQKQAIRDFMYDRKLPFPPVLLGSDFYFLYEVVSDCHDEGLDGYDIYQKLLRVKSKEPDLAGLIDAILTMDPGGYKPNHKSLADIGPSLTPVTWLWPDWIPRGFITVLAGDPSAGKSNMALDLARRVIHRLPAPDNQSFDIRSGVVLYIEGEDFLSGLYERALSWGMDTSKLYVLRREADDINLNLGERKYKDTLLDMCFDLRPDILVVDSFSTVRMESENSVEDVRGLLGFFSRISVDHHCALLLLHHLRKPKDSAYTRVTMHDLRGSSHIAVVPRNIIGLWLTSPTDKNGPRQVETIKANLGPYPPPLISKYQSNGTGFTITYEDFSAPALPDNLTGECAEWLLEFLDENGATPYRSVVTAAEKVGFKVNTLQNARKTLDWQVIDTVGKQRKGNKWALSNGVGDNGLSHGLMNHETPPLKNYHPPYVSHGHVTMWRRKGEKNEKIAATHSICVASPPWPYLIRGDRSYIYGREPWPGYRLRTQGHRTHQSRPTRRRHRRPTRPTGRIAPR